VEEAVRSRRGEGRMAGDVLAEWRRAGEVVAE